jgi:hypothetical protein
MALYAFDQPKMKRRWEKVLTLILWIEKSSQQKIQIWLANMLQNDLNFFDVEWGGNLS